jgi:hypothetical protein
MRVAASRKLQVGSDHVEKLLTDEPKLIKHHRRKQRSVVVLGPKFKRMESSELEQ